MAIPNAKNCIKGGVHHFVTKKATSNGNGGSLIPAPAFQSMNNITEVYCVQCALVIKLEEK